MTHHVACIYAIAITVTATEAAEMSQSTALAFDEFGRPFIIIRDQSTKKRLKGIEAHKVEAWGALVEGKTTHLSPFLAT